MAQTSIMPANWREVKIDGFMKQIGPLLQSKNLEDRKLYGLQTDKRHENAIGSIHGGVITSLLDQVIALEAWDASDRQPTVTVQMDTRFLGSARVGDFLETRVEIRHTARTLMFVDADIYCGAKLVASATAVMKITQNAG